MINLTGLKFGNLTVIEYSKELKKWNCICNCGTSHNVRADHLKQGRVISCGCIGRTKNLTHGLTNSKEYKVWDGIIQRCTNKNHIRFDSYGGRGIEVCTEWRNSFSKFYLDMGDKPSPKHTIDRINVNGNYCKENCRWVTREVQDSNMRKNIFIEFNGKIKTIKEWSIETGIHRNTIDYRYKNGLSPDKIFSKEKLKWGLIKNRPSSKINEKDIIKIRQDNRTQRVIANDFNVSQRVITRIKSLPLV